MPNETLAMSLVGLALTEASEGLRLQAYDDNNGLPLQTGQVPYGIATIGYGHTKGVYPGMICTQEQAKQWLLADLTDAISIVKQHVAVELNQGRGDALIDFVFNMGGGRPSGTLSQNDPGRDGFVTLASGRPSSLLRLVNAGDFDSAALEFEKWDTGGPPGLRVRHLRQRQLFVTGTWN